MIGGGLVSIEAVARRLGDLAPGEFLAALAVARRAPESEHPRLAEAIALRWPALTPVVPSTGGPVCPSYPAAHLDHQARVALGERPEWIFRGLTRAEAHEALKLGCEDPVEFLCRSLPSEVRRPDRVSVARWLVAAWADPPRRAALERDREVPGPGGAIVRGRWIDRVDEIRPVDLRPAGPATSIDAAFRRAADRLWRRWSAQHETDTRALASTPRWWVPIRCARPLLTRAELIREGREMHHCAGAYAPQVAADRSLIVAIAVRDGSGRIHRSTLELDRQTGEQRQHRGDGNGQPPELCRLAVSKASARWERSIGRGR